MAIPIVYKGIREGWFVQFAGIDITSMNVYLYVKKNISDTDAEALYTDSFLAGTHSDPTNGLTATKYEDAAHTSAMPKGTHWYEFRLFSGGTPINKVIGKVEYKETVIDKITE